MYYYDKTMHELDEIAICYKRLGLVKTLEGPNICKSHEFKINSTYLRKNLNEECDREIAVSYWPMFEVINYDTPIEDADYILYGHFYARFHHYRDFIIKEIEEIASKRKEGAIIIVVGKACNVKEYLDTNIKDIIFFESHYAECVGKFFNLPIKDEYFVYEKNLRTLNIWPVDGCKNKCKFCRRSYMNIPFESLSLEFIKNKLDWYKENEPYKLENIMLRAENLTEYGIDLYDKQALDKLIELIDSYEEVNKIKVFIGLNIGEMTDEIIDAFCKAKKIVELSLNIEAGSNRLLKLIGKKHTVEKIKEVFNKINQANPDIYIYSNVILGLPTETLDDIISLANLIFEIPINDLYILRYEMAEEHPLAKLPQLTESLYFYHLKMLLKIIVPSPKLKNRTMIVDCEDIRIRRRKTIRIKKRLKEEIENGICQETASHPRRTFKIEQMKNN